ncbi:hypothetical protein H4219_002237 [Mycoemilia scoparia]|uniref:Uncharacterized protein n=1 Tax=Mycoemilia scoparia TaxID=417184 RepID=A0A9W8A337_9FUNG|nr:hypothetical protein H4219_002237 [Mycoemilia scoparia]
MSSTKLQAVIREIDTVRCVGQWHIIPDLSSRYSKTVTESNEAFSSILLTEKLLEEELLNIKWNPKEHWISDGKTNATGQVSAPAIPPILQQSTETKKIQNQLDYISRKKMTPEELEVKIVL